MKVFISHGWQDRDLARKLGNELAAAGLEVWDADSQIYPGDNWAKKMGDALEQADVMVAIVTRDALQSGPLVADIQYALTSGKYGGRVVPVLVDFPSFVAGEDVPWILLRLNFANVSSTRPEWHEVVDKVRSAAETAPHAAG